MTDDSPSLADALEDLRGAANRRCQFCAYVATLEERDRGALTDALRSIDRRYTDRALAQIVTRQGYPVSYSTIGNHRNGVCSNLVPDWRERRAALGRAA